MQSQIFCQEGDILLVKALLAFGASVNHRDWNRFTPLDLAVHSQHSNVEALLLKYGAKPGVEFIQQEYILNIVSSYTSLAMAIFAREAEEGGPGGGEITPLNLLNNYNTNSLWHHKYIQLAPQLKFGAAVLALLLIHVHMYVSKYVTSKLKIP